MEKNLSLETSVLINAPASKVWDALTNPQLVKQYLFGTEVTSDWKVGSPITYKGSYQGKEYHDKGTIKKVEPGKVLQSTYWSSMSGKEDKPENYATVTYRLSKKDGGTILTLTQDNIENEKSKEHSEQNWKMVLQKLKEVVERKP
jgi:uncharacterized protein YndB with AHSA1/START domain